MAAWTRFATNPAWPAIIILAFILLFTSGAAKPLLLDNMDFPALAVATAAHGLPVYYRGEENPEPGSEGPNVCGVRNYRGEASVETLGLYHPPLYAYLLAAWIKVLGFAETQVRMFGMVCVLLQGLVTLALLRSLFGGEVVARWSGWFWLIFLLNPYTIQTASIADIDSTIYGPLLCAILLTVIKLSWRDGIWRTDPIRAGEYVLVAAAITLCMWAKLTTVLLVFPFIFFLLIPRLTVSRAARVTAGIVGAGVAGFLVTYFLYGRLTGLNINCTFAFTWATFLERGSSHGSGFASRLRDFRNNAEFMVPFMVRWTGLLPWLAGFWVTISAFLRAYREKDRRAAHLALLMSLALLTTAYYCGKVISFGSAPFKYVFVFWGLEVSAVVLLTFSANLPRPSALKTLAMVTLVALGAVFAAKYIGDHLMLTGAAGAYGWVVESPAMVFLIGAALRSKSLGRGLLAAGFAAYCGLNAGMALSQSKLDYATTYDYGETGFTDTVAFIRLNTTAGDVIASMKDIGFRSGRRYYENYLALYGTDQQEERFIRAIESGQVAYAVFTEGRGQDQLVSRPSLQKWVAEHCELVRSFGNYRIYKYLPASAR